MRTSDHRAIGVAVILVAFIAVWATLMSVRLATNATDVPRYHAYGEAIRHGQVPYRDFSVEYPPAALPTFAAPALAATGLRSYRIGFEILMCALGCVALGAVALTARALRQSELVPTALAAAGILALGPITLGHYDLWPAALVAAALAALLWEWRRTAAVLLGLAVAAKIYPAVLLPLGAVWIWRQRGRRDAIGWIGIAVATIAVCFVPLLVLAPHGVLSSIANQANRPLQLESSAAAGLLALHQLTSLQLGVEFSHSSVNLGGTPASLAAAATVIAEAAALIAVWALFVRGTQEPARLARAAAASVLAFVALGKVFSPQFLLWLLPLIPLAGGALGAACSAALGLTVVLTRAYFPGRWSDLIRFEALPTWLLVARDALLLCVLVALVRALRTPTATSPTARARHRAERRS